MFWKARSHAWPENSVAHEPCVVDTLKNLK